MSDFSEFELYEPVKDFFENLGYSVMGEVKNCDIVAKKDDDIIICEIKKSFNITLVYQLMVRQSLSSFVYAVIPRPKKGAKGRSWRNMLKLCKKLDFGLITVAIDSPVRLVEVIAEPEGSISSKNSKKEKSLKKEISLRTGDYNRGGVNRRKIMTAYRERSIELLCMADKLGSLTLNSLREFGYDKKEYSIIYKNYYSWFKKEGKGVYSLSDEGKKILENDEYSKVVEFYKKQIDDILK